MNKELDNLFKLTPEYVEKACKVAGEAFQDDPIMKNFIYILVFIILFFIIG